MEKTTIRFMAVLHRVVRDNEDATKLTLECDSQQIEAINTIPALRRLIISIEVDVE